MDTYRFAGLPSNSAVAATVTFIVAGWLLVAGGIILAESPAARMSIASPTAAAPLAAAPATPAPLPAADAPAHSPAPVATSAPVEDKFPPDRA